MSSGPTTQPDSGPPGFATIERTTIAGDSIEQIKRMIAERVLRPGEKLPSERELTLLLGVSRGTLREAIRALVSIGVLESKPGLGTYVTGLDSALLAKPFVFLFDANPGALIDLFDVRLMIEVGAAETAARQVSDEEIDELNSLLLTLKTSLDDLPQFYETDIAFHHVIHAATRNPLLVAVMDSLSVLGRRHRLGIITDRAIRISTTREHEAIAEALSRRDPAAASTAMKLHLTHIRSLFDHETLNPAGGRRTNDP